MNFCALMHQEMRLAHGGKFQYSPPMGYVDDHLLDGEVVVRRGQVSPTAYIGPAVLLLLGVATAALLVGIIFIIQAVSMIVRLATTEVAVTNRRVIGKVGLFAIRSLDLRLAKLEGVSVRRGLLGAIFNYGSVMITGSGSIRTTLRGMRDPEGLRRAFVDAAENSGAVEAYRAGHDLPKNAALPIFEVQVIDGTSGHEAWVEVKAKDREEAIRRATDTGMVAGFCRLKSLG